jgi:hypothetical protein
MGANTGYGGIRFYTDHPSVSSTEIMSIGNSDSNVRVWNDLYIGSVGGWASSRLCRVDGTNCPAAAGESDTLQSVTDRGRSTTQWIQSPRFEDRDNTGYYVDPASTSRMNEIQADRVYGFTDIRSPIFYDYDNTNYYINPYGMSNIRDLTIDATLSSAGRMHLYGPELLYLLHRNGVIIGKEWGGNGNLQVQGDLSVSYPRITGARTAILSFDGAGNHWVRNGCDSDSCVSMSFKSNGGIHINSLSKGSGSFLIDHPLDPENKNLQHSFVESPEMANIYKGRAILENGTAIIELPDYFNTLNAPDNREILLTPIDEWTPLYTSKIKNNKFIVKTTKDGKQNAEFSWMVLAVRNDPLAREKRIEVETDKGVNESCQYENACNAENWITADEESDSFERMLSEVNDDAALVELSS